MTRDEALALAATGWWEHATQQQIAEFQLTEARLCVPFDVFREAIEKCLGRGVQTLELAMDRDGLISELLGDRKPPEVEALLRQIPGRFEEVVVEFEQ